MGTKGTRYGTHHFIDLNAAYKYYGFNKGAVNQKIAEHEIEIGKPIVKANERLLVNRDEGRYIIEINEWSEEPGTAIFLIGFLILVVIASF